ncbi:BspA family leucine-rich repeat surface protein [Enterococcus hirae]|nr:BspA family leucine-rich repeat surface protein [Enterococcus hirae]
MRKKISILLLGIMLMQNTTTCVGVYAADTDTTEDTTKEAPAFLQDQRSFPGSEERKKQENESRSTIDTSMSSTQEVTPSSSSKSKEDSDMTQFSNSNEKNVTKTEIKDKLVTANWQWSHNGNVITLQDYVGTSKDVLIPTARDLGRDGAEVHISSAVLKDAAQGATSIKASFNGNPISITKEQLYNPYDSFNSLFESNNTLRIVSFSNLLGSVTDISRMFFDCSNLTSVDLGGINTTKVTNMCDMFNGCSSLTSINWRNIDTSNVTDMSGMFFACNNLTSVDLSNFDTQKVTKWGNMFWVLSRKPILVKTTDVKLKNYDYANDTRSKMGTVKIDAAYGTIGGQASISLFDDYTTDQDLTEELVTHQLKVAKGKLQLKPGAYFYNWAPEGNYQTFLEKAQGTYNAKVSSIVNIPDAQLAKNIRTALSIVEGNPITEEDMAKLTTTQNGLLTDVKDYTGLEKAVNLEILSTYHCGTISSPKLPNDLSQLTKLHTIVFSGDDGHYGTNELTNESIRSFATLPGKQIKTLVLRNNHLTDLTPLKGKVTDDCGYHLDNQTVTEEKQTVIGNSVTVKVKEIKNIDGSKAEITPSNSGVYDKEKGTITWKGLTKETTSLSYGWKGKDTFTGVVTLPVEVKEDKVVNIPDSKLKTEINNELNREKINGKTNRASNENVNWSELSQVTKLDICSKEITDLTGLECLGNKKVNWLALAANSILDLSCLKEKVTDTNPYLENQTVTEEKQTVIGNSVTVKVKEIKNIDGSTPEITPSNGGVYDKEKGTITWTDLNKDTKNVSYSWKGNGATSEQHKFSGVVILPVEVKEDKVVNIPDSKLKTEINNELNREKINGKTNRASNENVNWSELSQVTKLDICSKEITDLTGLECLGNKKVNWLALAANSILDLSCLKEKVTDTNPYLENQTVTEEKQTVIGNSVTVKVKEIKNIDGSTPEITPSNGGVYDKEKGTITWTDLNKDTKNVSYSWKGNGATSEQHKFSGVVILPVEVKEDKVVNIPDSKLKTEINNELNREKINGKTNRASNENVNWSELSQVTKLDICSKEITDLTGLECLGNKKVNWLALAANSILDLSCLKEKVTDTNPYLENQTVTEEKQTVIGNSVTVKVKEIKNIDGSTPEITPSNGGVYDKEKGTITWTDLNKDTKNVSYSWKGNGATSEQHKFSGVVTLPVEVENKVTAGWEWNQAGHVITLYDYVGTSKDVLIPTAKDLGQEGAEVQISSAVLKDAAQGATSIKTSTNGAPIIVSDHSFDSVFEKNQTLETVTFNNLNTTNVTNAKEMFFDCSNLKRVDLSSFDTSNMTNLYSMFSTCPNLTSVDLSSFNTTNVTDMSFMFYSCTSLTTLDLSSFNTSKIVPQNMYGAFWSTTYVPLLIKTTDPQLKNYDYASSNRTKMGTVKIDAAYGTIDGQASTSLFDYTTDQDLTDELVNQQLEAAQQKLTLEPAYKFDSWKAEGAYTTFEEKAQGVYQADIKYVEITLKQAKIKKFTGDMDIYRSLSENIQSVKKLDGTAGNLNDVKITAKSPTGAVAFDQLRKEEGTYTITYTFTDDGATISTDMELEVRDTPWIQFETWGWPPGFGVRHAASVILNNNQLSLVGDNISSGGAPVGLTFNNISVYVFGADGTKKVIDKRLPSMQQSFYSLAEGDLITIGKVNDRLICKDGDSSNLGKDLSARYLFYKVKNGQLIQVPMFKVKDSVVKVGQKWDMWDNIDYALDYNWNKITATNPPVAPELSEPFTSPTDVLKLSTDNVVNTNVAGEHPINFSYGSLKKTANIKVENFILPIKTGTATWNFRVNTIEQVTTDTENPYYVTDLVLDSVSSTSSSNEKLEVPAVGELLKNNSTLTGINPDLTDVYIRSVGLTKSGLDSLKNMKIPYSFKVPQALKPNLKNWAGIQTRVTDQQGNPLNNLTGLFSTHKNLTSVDLKHLDTSNVTNLTEIFINCSGLTNANLSTWNTSNVTSMKSVFYGCTSLTNVNLNSWNTSNVTNMYGMFEYCSGLTNVDLSSFDIQKVTDWRYMFWVHNKTPFLVKTTDARLKAYNYVSDNRTKMGTVKIDAQYGSFAGEQSLSLFDYTTDQDLTDELVNHQLEEAKKKLTLESTTQFDSWSPEGSYATFLEKAQGIYNVKVMIVPDCSVVVPTSYKLTDAKTLAKSKVNLIDNKTQKEYAGKLIVGITISSKQKFKLGTEQEISNGIAGEYQLVDDQKNPLNLSTGIQLDGNKTEQALNVLLTKENKEGKIGSDILSFEYQITLKDKK